jgi:toxin ParE1/3/4
VKVRLARSAEADLAAIADWISEDDPRRAASFVRELQGRCMSLAHRPKRFPVARHIDGQPIRKFSHRGYLVFYAVLENRVEVIHIVHGARDWGALLLRK